MTRLRAVLAAAAIAVLGGGVTVWQAFTTAGIDEGLTVPMLCEASQRLNNIQEKHLWYIAIPQDQLADLPQAWPEGEGGRLLGVCNGGTCEIGPSQGHECNLTYTYELGGIADGYRVAVVYSHKYFANGWRLWAKSTSAEAHGDRVYFWTPTTDGAYATVISACLSVFTGPQCKVLLDMDNKCLFLPDGSACRYGQHLGVDEACPYAQALADPDNALMYPCTVYRGAGSERTDALRVWEPEEMDEL